MRCQVHRTTLARVCRVLCKVVRRPRPALLPIGKRNRVEHILLSFLTDFRSIKTAKATPRGAHQIIFGEQALFPRLRNSSQAVGLGSPSLVASVRSVFFFLCSASTLVRVLHAGLSTDLLSINQKHTRTHEPSLAFVDQNFLLGVLFFYCCRAGVLPNCTLNLFVVTLEKHPHPRALKIYTAAASSPALCGLAPFYTFLLLFLVHG